MSMLFNDVNVHPSVYMYVHMCSFLTNLTLPPLLIPLPLLSPSPTEKIELALVSSDTGTLLFDITRFLLQAIFVTMEEEKENHIESLGKETCKAEGKGEEGEARVEEEEVEDKQDDAREGDGDAVKEEVAFGDEEMEKPLDIRVEAIRASAATFARWSHLTQRLPLSEMVLDPYTCSEVLRLHLLSSGGYADAGDRTWFRHCRRGGYSDGDDPAIALQLSRPDILEQLRHVPFYDLFAADKLEVLATLCSQLLSYSVSRELIEESAARVKKAQRRIREIQHCEERRKKEERAAQIRERKRERLEKLEAKKQKETQQPAKLR